jgi:ATP-dependent Clp protease ATP-binding subunit ClpC
MTDFDQISAPGGISGVLIDGHFWYYKDEVTESTIVLRKGKAKAQKIINFIVVAFGLGALLIFGLGMVLQFSDALLDPKTWTSASGTMFAFWLAVLSGLFLFYRLVDENTKGKTVPQPSDGRPVELSTIPSLDVVERKENIAAILTPDSQTMIDEAYRLAAKAGHIQVTASHLFLGGISTTSIQMLFVRLGLSFAQMKDPLRRHMATLDKGDTEFGVEARTILAEAFGNAVAHNRPVLSVIEIFLEAYKKDEFLRELFFSMEVEEDQLESVVNWIRINEQLVDRYNAYRKSAANKPKGNMDRAYTAVQTKFLDQVSEDLTRAGVLGHLPLLIGRDSEMSSLLRAIEGGSQSVVLVGPAGVGKKTLIAGLAERMVEEDVPKILQDKRLVKLSIPHIVSAQGGSGAEERLLIALQEVGMSGNIILVIEGIEQLVGAGTGVDLSSILASELDKRYTFVIGTTTPQGYLALEKSVLVNKLEKVLVEEPERKDAIEVLEAKIGGIEGKHKVVFTYAAVESLVDMSMRYLHDSYLPHKAIVLAQEVALQVSKTGEDWTRVGKQDVAKIISEKSKIPITEVDQAEGQKLLNLEEEIHKRVIGQDDAVKAVSSALRRARMELRAEGRPIANFLFLGPTGVGKTELAKATAEVYFGSENAMLRFDMSEYQDKPSVIRLIGTSGEGGLLTEAVRKNPFALVLLDELEKAHPDILNLFLQVMDDGRLTDGTGRTIDFTNIILIATSNAATQYIMDSTAANVPMETIRQTLMEEELKTVYRPEFLNRFDGVMVFTPLSKEDVVAIAYLMIEKVVARLALKGITFRASDEAVHELAAKGYDPKFGARPLRRVIQEDVDNSVAEYLLQGKVSRRDTLVLNPGGEIVVEKAAQL